MVQVACVRPQAEFLAADVDRVRAVKKRDAALFDASSRGGGGGARSSGRVIFRSGVGGS